MDTILIKKYIEETDIQINNSSSVSRNLGKFVKKFFNGDAPFFCEMFFPLKQIFVKTKNAIYNLKNDSFSRSLMNKKLQGHWQGKIMSSVGSTCTGKFIWSPAPSHKPFAPVYCFPFIYCFCRVQKVVQDFI